MTLSLHMSQFMAPEMQDVDCGDVSEQCSENLDSKKILSSLQCIHFHAMVLC